MKKQAAERAIVSLGYKQSLGQLAESSECRQLAKKGREP